MGEERGGGGGWGWGKGQLSWAAHQESMFYTKLRRPPLILNAREILWEAL